MKFLKTKYYNIVCLQETHSTKKVEKVWKSQWGSQVLYSHGTSNSRGCMILIKKGLKTKIHNLGADKEGRYILVDRSVKDYRFCLCNVYAPNADDVDFFRKVIQIIDSWTTDCLIMAGDFNTSMTLKDKYIDKEPMGPGHPKVVAFLQDFLESANMLDIWRIRHPEDRRFTWSITKPKCPMERLDYIFISANLSSAVILTDIDPKFCSDHAIPYLVLNDEAVSNKGPGYWKLNTTHLEENEYKELIKTII